MRRALVAALVGLVAGAAAFLVATSTLPDLEVRAVPWLTHLGATLAEHAPGQRFRCDRDGLHRIDVGVNRLDETPPSVLELVLREGGPAGEVLRRVAGSDYQQDEQRSWVGFEFEPLERSAGRDLHLTLLPSGGKESIWVGAWARVRGLSERHVDWGPEALPGPTVTGEFLSHQRDLRAMAFAFRAVDGQVELVLREPKGGAELRRVEVQTHSRNGWVAFPFERMPASRWRELGYELRLPQGAELLGVAGVPSLVSVHGSGAVDPRLGGLTLGGEERAGLDLVLRTWTSSGPFVALALLRERMGWRLWPALVLWLAASALLAQALPRPRA